MKLNDIQNNPVADGYLKVERLNVTTGDWEVEFHEKNLVLDFASTVLRDLMFGDEISRITKIFFGDMGLVPPADMQNVAAPQPTDVALTNKLYEKVATKTKITYAGSPAIEYVVTLEAAEFNGTGSQLITEYALGNDINQIFTRKTRAAVYKDAESTLRMTWTLVFA